MGKPVVAFVCTHNACRSQIAEAMARRFADDVMLARSAGTHPAKIVNPDAARLLASEYEFDVTSLEPKSLTCLPDVDILITMGCGVECPSLPAMYREDWGLEDPTGKGDDAFLRTMRAIQQRVIGLRARIVAGEFDRERLASNLKALGDPNRYGTARSSAPATSSRSSRSRSPRSPITWRRSEMRGSSVPARTAVGCTTSSTTMSSMQSPRCSDRASHTAHGRIQRSRQRVQASANRTADACRAGVGHPTISRPSARRWTVGFGRATLTLARPMDSGPMRGHHREETRRPCAFRHLPQRFC